MPLEREQRVQIRTDFLNVTDGLMAQDAQLLPGRALYNLVEAFDEANGSSLRHRVSFEHGAAVTAMNIMQQLEAHNTLDQFYAFLPTHLEDKGITVELAYKP